ncbi:glycine--tRNA ligase subunit beta [Virgibacillus kimchii]
MAKDVLFEIGLEELPARFIDQAEKELREKTADWLDELRIKYESIDSFSTPRRLSVIITGLSDQQTSLEEEVKGPAEKIAKNAEGNWSRAAEGFTRGQGKTVEDIYIKEVKGTPYIFVKKYVEGEQTATILPEFKHIILSLTFGKNMRWGAESVRYARPIRWIAALHGEKIIPFEIAGVRSGNITYGHRFLGDKITLTNPEEYEAALLDNYVIGNAKKREQRIVKEIKELEAKDNIQVPIEESLLVEVRNLVEYPTVFTGKYDESFLTLPPEVLITSMKEHQRYFPVKSTSGDLLPRFVGVRNGDDHELETVVKGNEKVLRARLQDAKFFYEDDKRNSLDYYLAKLERVVFQEKLGTYHDKVQRVVHITEELTKLLQLDSSTSRSAIRAAEICKFDLMTNMVNEFTELQGIIGEKYALTFGESEQTAKAVGEHYMPVHANAKLPQTMEGSLVSIADKLDTVVGCISVGLKPTGSQDPYALRRQAAGILKILNENEWNISLEHILVVAEKLFEKQAQSATWKEDVRSFFNYRTQVILKDNDLEQDVIQAVLHQGVGVIHYTAEKANVLSEKRHEAIFKPVHEALVRVLNIANKTDLTEVNTALLKTDSEKVLYEKFLSSRDQFMELNNKLDARKTLAVIGELTEEIHDFFEHNMVMADEEELKNNRLAMMNNIAVLIKNYADLSQIEWKQTF